MNIIKIAIIEDDRIVMESLKLYFSQKPDVLLIYCFRSIEEFVLGLNNKDNDTPDVMLLDIQLPGKSGIEGIPLIKEKFPDLNIIMLTTFDDSEKIFKALSAGACSYLSKQSTLHTIYECIVTVSKGGSFMSPAIARKVIEYFEKKHSEFNSLSSRQSEIVSCIVDGMSYKMVASKLEISLDTVRTHIMQIYRTLNINSKGQLIKWAMDKK
ncbi:MAG: response regulator transcription factor [Saprospiraceae bacterium]|nr:response regulator transcription factor [Saprospiraceae bacterium]